MILRWHWRNHRLTLACVKVEETIGLNSLLPDGNHILMWDIDESDYYKMQRYLLFLQNEIHLPSIYIFQSSVGHYHAICLRRSSWREAITAAAAIPTIDMQWLRGCVSRGYFTLRIGMKYRVFEPKPLAILDSPTHENVAINDLVNYDRYETLAQ